jgi:hypothetical protein
LMNCPDTRFLAAYIFGKYCGMVIDEGAPAERSSMVLHSYMPSEAIVRIKGRDASSAHRDFMRNRQEQLGEGMKRLIWDLAVASIALSVKVCSICVAPVLEFIITRSFQVHRDTLPPLSPVYARHYLALAPHNMSREDLEVARCTRVL